MAHDASYQTGIYIKQGGQKLHIGNQVVGPEGTGALVEVGKNAAIPALDVVVTAAAGAANVSNVTVQFQDGLGNALTTPVNFDILLSDAASGAGLSAHAATGGIAAGASGTLLTTYVTGKAGRMQTDATGKAILAITDTSKTAYVVVVQVPGIDYFTPALTLAGASYG